MTDSAPYSAGDAIYDLGVVRALTIRLADSGECTVGEAVDAGEYLDRVQSWIADSPAMHAAHVEAHRVFAEAQERTRAKAAEWAIPRIDRTVDYAETSADLEEHLGERPPIVTLDALGRLVIEGPIVEPLLTGQGVVERMADELEQHIAAAGRRAADEAEKIAQAGTEEYGTG